MFDWIATPELLKGGIVALVSVLSLSLYLKSVDNKLMRCEAPIKTNLTIAPAFRLFTAIFVACSVLIAATILQLGLAGSPSELAFTLVLLMFASVPLCFLIIQVFFTSVTVSGDMVTLDSPVGRKQLKLSLLRSISINNRFQFKLSDGEATLRFCHFVEGKRALIEHFIEYAPTQTSGDLRALLDNPHQRKPIVNKLSLL